MSDLDKKIYICNSSPRLTKEQLVTCGKIIIAASGEKTIKPWGGGLIVNLETCNNEVIEKLYNYISNIVI